MATFWTTAAMLPVTVVLLLSNSLMLSASVGVAVAYGPVAVRAVLDENRSPRSQRILLGIFYAWAFGSIWRIHSLIWLKAGSPGWFVNNDLIAFYQSGVTLGALYHLTSPGAVGGERGERVPSLKWLAAGVVVAVAVMLTLVLTTYDIDTSRFVEALRPYVPR